MFNLVSGILAVVLLLLIIVLGCLVYLYAAYKAEIENQLAELERRDSIAKKNAELRKLYTFVSTTDQLENVIRWEKQEHHLRLSLNDGSIYFVSTPAEYKLIIQDQSEDRI